MHYFPHKPVTNETVKWAHKLRNHEEASVTLTTAAGEQNHTESPFPRITRTDAGPEMYGKISASKSAMQKQKAGKYMGIEVHTSPAQ